MKKILDAIQTKDDLKRITIEEKEQLASEIREEIINVVSQTGGHLASNLGVVELTIALHSIFDIPNDKVIWDVGHQTYVHKMLTGRKDKLKTLRQLNGIAGFPKTGESECDCFNTGHSSTSISVALGMAKARDLKKEQRHVIAVIGDGALTGGMALEALNDAGSSKTNLIVILNDNEMSISKNVGGVSLFLSKLRTRKFYTESNSYIKKILRKIPGGTAIIRLVRKMKNSVKQILMPTMLFENLGFRYLGPVDGHDIKEIESIFNISKKLEGPILIHAITKKGKGYAPAEKNPDKFHSTSSFEKETGKAKKAKKPDYSKVFGDTLTELARKDKTIVAITAAMKDGTGLTEFAKEFPDRIFDVGIAEQHAVGFAAGLAKAGMHPVVPIYSSFYQRAYDQVIHDVCIQGLPVVLCVDRAGVVGNDGETHQGLLDLSFFSLVPNLTVMAPKDFAELKEMLAFAMQLKKPVAIRYPRGGQGNVTFASDDPICLGKSEILAHGKDLTIIAIGKMVERGEEVRRILETEGIEAGLINARFVKPIEDEKMIAEIAKTKKVITIEDNIIKGGLGSSILEEIRKADIDHVTVKMFGYPDEFVKHASVEQIEQIYGLDASSIAKEVGKLIKEK